jgi:hypothetical protein
VIVRFHATVGKDEDGFRFQPLGQGVHGPAVGGVGGRRFQAGGLP